MRKIWNAVKWPLAVICILAGVICLLLAFSYLGENDDLAAILSGLGVVLLGEAVFCIHRARKKKQAAAAGQLGQKTESFGKFRHASGLPLAEGVECGVSRSGGTLHIAAMNQVFTLAEEKIRGAAVLTQKAAEKHFVPRLLWVRKKTVRSFSRCLVLTYADTPDQPGKTIVFQLGEWNVDKARRLAAHYKGLPTAHIEL